MYAVIHAQEICSCTIASLRELRIHVFDPMGQGSVNTAALILFSSVQALIS